jgi:hypothetical protein
LFHVKQDQTHGAPSLGVGGVFHVE